MVMFDVGQRRLVAEFLANIGVAWFTAGVIGIFIASTTSLTKVISSLSWGIILSTIFVWFGFSLLKGVKS